MSGQPVESTRETNTRLGLIAMLPSHNGAKWYGNGARGAHAAGCGDMMGVTRRGRTGSRQQRGMTAKACRSFQSGKMKAK